MATMTIADFVVGRPAQMVDIDVDGEPTVNAVPVKAEPVVAPPMPGGAASLEGEPASEARLTIQAAAAAAPDTHGKSGEPSATLPLLLPPPSQPPPPPLAAVPREWAVAYVTRTMLKQLDAPPTETKTSVAARPDSKDAARRVPAAGKAATPVKAHQPNVKPSKVAPSTKPTKRASHAQASKTSAAGKATVANALVTSSKKVAQAEVDSTGLRRNARKRPRAEQEATAAAADGAAGPPRVYTALPRVEDDDPAPPPKRSHYKKPSPMAAPLPTPPRSPHGVAPRPARSPTPGDRAARRLTDVLTHGPRVPAGQPATHRCLWERQWYPVSLVRQSGQRWRVHYKGYSDSSDEWVSVETGRLVPMGPSDSDQDAWQARELELAKSLVRAAAAAALPSPPPASEDACSPGTVRAVYHEILARLDALAWRLVWVPVHRPGHADPVEDVATLFPSTPADATLRPAVWWPAVVLGTQAAKAHPRPHEPTMCDVCLLRPQWSADDVLQHTLREAPPQNDLVVQRAALRVLVASVVPGNPGDDVLPLPVGTPTPFLTAPDGVPLLSIAEAEVMAAAEDDGAAAWRANWTRAVATARTLYLTASLAGRLSAARWLPSRLDGHGLTAEYVAEQGTMQPCTLSSLAGLEATMPTPAELSFQRVGELLGGDRHVPVIDVDAQHETDEDWSLAAVIKYFESAAPTSADQNVELDAYTPCRRRRRAQTLNVLSLEISGTALAQSITPPRLVRQLDWTNLTWPTALKASAFPQVQLYCLMSAEGSFTDFHVDFGGSSVFYHVIRGEKVFYLAPPTPANLRAYEAWTLGVLTLEDVPPPPAGAFLEMIPPEQRYMAVVRAGESLLLPGGWIHAVSTPADSLVIGGNFLHSFNVAQQVHVHQLEQRAGVAARFQYPFFSAVHWYVLDWYLQRLDCLDHVNSAGAEAEGVAAAARTWPPWCAKLWPAEADALPALYDYLHGQLVNAARQLVRDPHTPLELPFSLGDAHQRLTRLGNWLARREVAAATAAATVPQANEATTSGATC